MVRPSWNSYSYYGDVQIFCLNICVMSGLLRRTLKTEQRFITSVWLAPRQEIAENFPEEVTEMTWGRIQVKSRGRGYQRILRSAFAFSLLWYVVWVKYVRKSGLIKICSCKRECSPFFQGSETQSWERAQYSQGRKKTELLNTGEWGRRA